MRIALRYDPPAGGSYRAFDEVTRRLSERHKVTRYALSGFKWQPRRKLRGGLYWNDWLTYRDEVDAECVERELAAQIDADGHDVALVSVLRSGLAPSTLRHLATTTAYYCHEPPRRFYEPHCRPEANPITWWERGRLIWRRPAQTVLDSLSQRRDVDNVRSASLVMTNSHYTAGRVAAVYGRRAEVCYLGVNSDLFTPPADLPPPTRVVSVGAFEAHKGFDFLIEALGRVSAPRRPRLVIVGLSGHPRMPGYLQRLAAAAGVELELLRGVTDSELVRLLQHSALFLFGAHLEPFGLVMLEAMACGLPCVAVAEGGVPESVEDGRTGFVVPRAASAFADAVETLLADARLRRELGRAARQSAVTTWTWDDATRRIEAHLELLAAGPLVGSSVG